MAGIIKYVLLKASRDLTGALDELLASVWLVARSGLFAFILKLLSSL